MMSAWPRWRLTGTQHVAHLASSENFSHIYEGGTKVGGTRPCAAGPGTSQAYITTGFPDSKPFWDHAGSLTGVGRAESGMVAKEPVI